MFADTKSSLVAALIVTTCFGMVEMSRSPALAAEPITMTRIEAYAAARIDTAFDLVAAMPASAPVMVPMAQKGDLLVPPGCVGMGADAQAECMDVADQPPANRASCSRAAKAGQRRCCAWT